MTGPISPAQRRANAARPKAKRPPKPPVPSLRPFGWVADPAKTPKFPEGTVEAHALKNQVAQWRFDAAKAMLNWPQGAELSEENFLAAIAAVDGIRLR